LKHVDPMGVISGVCA